MTMGLSYDSAEGRALCGALSAIMTGTSYATSGEMAKEPRPSRLQEKRRATCSGDPQPPPAAHGESAAMRASRYHQCRSITPLASRPPESRTPDRWDKAPGAGELTASATAQTTVVAPTAPLVS